MRPLQFGVSCLRILVAFALAVGTNHDRSVADVRGSHAHEVRRRFALGTPADVAWAAWLAAENDLEEFREEIAARLRTPERLGTRERWLVECVLLDAAIRLRVPASAIDLRPLVKHHPEAVAVLVLGGPPPTEALDLLELLDRDGDTHVAWVALGNHLGTSRTPGFAAWVLRRVPWEVRLAVYSTDDTAVEGPYPAPPTGTVPGCGSHRLPPALPPIPRYRIQVRARTASEPAAPPHVVSISRTVARDGELGFASSLVRGPPRRDVLLGWVRDAAGNSALARAFGIREDWRLDWVGRQPWERYLQPRVDAIHVAHWALVADLVARGYLTPAEARDVAPAVRVQVFDRRRDPRRVLPPVPPARVPNPWVVVFAPRPRRIV